MKRTLSPRPADLLALAASLALPCGCHPAAEVEAAPQLELRIPAGEAASIGSYAVIVRWPDGPADRIAGERDGSVNAVWFTDLDQDGRGEVVVSMSSAGSGSYGQLQGWRRGEDGLWRLIELPGLDPDQAVGYRGHDRFELVDGVLRREFPVFLEPDANAAPTGGTRRLVLAATGARWSDATGG
ncbi:MAG: hypothetical protein H8E31_03090 [Planctomycetes bacterium]|nr:hypothetical protein [Planctomycetota bacterium]